MALENFKINRVSSNNVYFYSYDDVQRLRVHQVFLHDIFGKKLSSTNRFSVLVDEENHILALRPQDLSKESDRYVYSIKASYTGSSYIFALTRIFKVLNVKFKPGKYMIDIKSDLVDGDKVAVFSYKEFLDDVQ